jgi:osmotically inducible protein OsmC
MPTRSAEATWEGGLKGGKGTFKGASGAISAGYSFGTRFEGAPGTNPEELLGAAHSACYSMALAATLEGAGHKPTQVHTTAAVTIDSVPGGFKITKIKLVCDATVPGLDDATFQKTAIAVKAGCPVSQALSAVPMELEAKLNK